MATVTDQFAPEWFADPDERLWYATKVMNQQNMIGSAFTRLYDKVSEEVDAAVILHVIETEVKACADLVLAAINARREVLRDRDQEV